MCRAKCPDVVNDRLQWHVYFLGSLADVVPEAFAGEGAVAGVGGWPVAGVGVRVANEGLAAVGARLGWCCFSCLTLAWPYIKSFANDVKADEFNPSSTRNLLSTDRSDPWIVCLFDASRLRPRLAVAGNWSSAACWGGTSGELVGGGREIVPFWPK